MKDITAFTILGFGVLIAGALLVFATFGTQATTHETPLSPIAKSDDTTISTYKSPLCGCCTGWASYMTQQEYIVDVTEIDDMASVKKQYGVPTELESCHTSTIGGYVVEGHVPEIAVAKLLAEKPNIRGIALAGMPSGTPGMPGPKQGPYIIYEITHEGTKGNVFMEI